MKPGNLREGTVPIPAALGRVIRGRVCRQSKALLAKGLFYYAVSRRKDK
jgi:hypothetical protein